MNQEASEFVNATLLSSWERAKNVSQLAESRAAAVAPGLGLGFATPGNSRPQCRPQEIELGGYRMTIDQELNAALERLAAQKNEPRVKEWLATRKKAGEDLDPEKTAEVMWIHAQTLDPYGVCREMPGELNSVGREWFARAVGSDIWGISYDDLPRAVVERLEQRIAAGDFDQISALPEIKRLEALTTQRKLGK